MTIPHPTIRHARPDDAPALRHLIQQSAKHLCLRDYATDVIDRACDVHGFAVLDEQLIADRTYFVAEVWGEIVGCGGWGARAQFLKVRSVLDRRLIELRHPSTSYAAIRSVFVKPGWSGLGIGRRLVRTAESNARLVGFDAFEIAATLTGIPLYRKLGYRRTADYHLPLGVETTFPVALMHKEDADLVQ